MFIPPFFNRSHGVLGINARNLQYVSPYNPKSAKRFADDKLKTKAFLMTRGIPAAKIYARIEDREQLRKFDFSQLPDECVLKPNYGYGGEGILILKGRKNGTFLRNGKRPISNSELMEHMEDILDGKFSLGGRKDTPFFEQILTPDACFAPFRPMGLPDLRIIVFNLVPIMAMLRIPTAESEGKANVHLGGIGIGIDIAKGTTTHAAQYHHMITKLPHGESVSGIKIPHWDDILLICSKIQQLTNIGYLACDITIDEHMGPALLEVNARAGLMVQVANLAPLGRRLQRVKGLKVGSPEKGVRMGQDLFGQKTRSSARQDGRPTLGLRESITIAGSGTSAIETAFVSTEHERTAFNSQLIEELKSIDAIDEADEKEGAFRVKFTLGGSKIQTLAIRSDDMPDGKRALIGRRDLSGFLIDPTKSSKATEKTSTVKSDLRAVDKLLEQVDKDLLLLKYVKPVNLDEERSRAEKDPLYNPVFQYREVDVDLNEATKRLSEAVKDESPMGHLLEKKRQELLLRIELLKARGDAKEFTKRSFELYGKPTQSLLKHAKIMLSSRPACALPPKEKDLLTAEKTAEKMQAVLDKYSLHNWKVDIRQKLVANCTVGGGSVYIRADATFDPVYVDALIKHEIETHVLTAENGTNQPYALFRRGCAGYLDTQEGLAVYNQNRIYTDHHEKWYNPPRNALATQFALSHSFAETRAYLSEELGYDEQKALSQAVTIKRGLRNTSEHGGFTKSLVYLRGLLAVKKFLKNGGNMADLYVGKIALEDIEDVLRIEELKRPLLLPEFLRDNEEE